MKIETHTITSGAIRSLPQNYGNVFESPDSHWAAGITWEEADPVSDAPRCTSVMLAETFWVPCAACCTFRDIPWVAVPCSFTAAAIVEEISECFFDGA
jgi:hypothetical protein